MLVDTQWIGMCGACEWKSKTNCPGCLAARSRVFWGTCEVAKCALEKDFPHCGFCPDLPCAALQHYFDNPDHGDNGERLDNLKAWAGGQLVYKQLTRKKP
jgi:hypothetical protein